MTGETLCLGKTLTLRLCRTDPLWMCRSIFEGLQRHAMNKSLFHRPLCFHLSTLSSSDRAHPFAEYQHDRWTVERLPKASQKLLGHLVYVRHTVVCAVLIPTPPPPPPTHFP